MMIGPSAPNGPPEPIATADDRGFSTATLADMRLPPIRIASMASGMPWPRIFSEPKRAISPITRPPIAGAQTIQALGRTAEKLMVAVEALPSQIRLEARAISFSSAQAPRAPPAPTTKAMATSIRSRRSAVKSPSAWVWADASGAPRRGAYKGLVILCLDWSLCPRRRRWRSAAARNGGWPLAISDRDTIQASPRRLNAQAAGA